MPSLWKPSLRKLRRTLAAQARLKFTYKQVGATATPNSPLSIPHSYAVDVTRVELGQGADVFQRAKSALSMWRQFNLGWLEVWPGTTPLRTGETVLVIARAGGLWWTNAARIVYALDENSATTSRFGFAYGTLPGHVESGEERFLIEWDRATDVVYFDIFAFSRPRHPLVRLNCRRARSMQRRFANEAAAVMKSVASGED